MEAATLPTVDIKELTRMAITQALRECYGNRTHAAFALKMSVRTLQRWIKVDPQLRRTCFAGAADATI